MRGAARAASNGIELPTQDTTRTLGPRGGGGSGLGGPQAERHDGDQLSPAEASFGEAPSGKHLR